MEQRARPLRLFYSYAQEDEVLRVQLERHLSTMRHQGLISEWHSRVIRPGTVWQTGPEEVDEHLKMASIVLLLISSDFLASDYRYHVEMQYALSAHERGEMKVVPILLRPCDWTSAPFAHLYWLPQHGPVTAWPDRDAAFLEIVNGLRKLIEHLSPHNLPQNNQAPTSLRRFKPFVHCGMLKGHASIITSLVITPDGRTLISGSLDTMIKFRYLATGEELLTLHGDSGVRSVVLDVSRNMLASGHDGGIIKIWEFSSGKEVRSFRGHKSEVLCLALSADGRMLVSGSRDHTIKIWDLKTKKEQRTFTEHTEGVTCLALDPGKVFLASGSSDGTIKLWGHLTNRWAKFCTLCGHEYSVTGMVHTTDWNTLVSGDGGGILRIWKPHMARDIQATQTWAGHPSSVGTLLLDRDERTVLSTHSEIKVWDLATRVVLQTLLAGHTGEIEALALSPNGQILVSGDWDGMINIWQRR